MSIGCPKLNTRCIYWSAAEGVEKANPELASEHDSEEGIENERTNGGAVSADDALETSEDNAEGERAPFPPPTHTLTQI